MEPFISEIRIFAFNFPPTGWARCDGQLVPISQNTALFSLLGTTYGGDGKNTFGLPDLQGRAPMQAGQGPGLSLYNLGEEGGMETTALPESQIPAHTHTLMAQNVPMGSVATAAGNSYTKPASGNLYDGTNRAPITMAQGAIAPTGNGAAHNNMMPYLTGTFCIALQGVYPAKS